MFIDFVRRQTVIVNGEMVRTENAVTKGLNGTQSGQKWSVAFQKLVATLFS